MIESRGLLILLFTITSRSAAGQVKFCATNAHLNSQVLSSTSASFTLMARAPMRLVVHAFTVATVVRDTLHRCATRHSLALRARVRYYVYIQALQHRVAQAQRRCHLSISVTPFVATLSPWNTHLPVAKSPSQWCQPSKCPSCRSTQISLSNIQPHTLLPATESS